MTVFILLAVLIVLLVVEGWIYERYWPTGINATVKFSERRATEGDTAELIETIEYTGKLPLPWVRIKFRATRDIRLPDSANSIVTDYYNREDVFSVGRMEKITRRLPVVCEKRGYQRICDVDAVSSDLFHTRKLVESFKGNSTLTVYPRRTEIPELPESARQMLGDHIVRQAKFDDPFVFRGIREYVPGDPTSRINWKATARTGELAVNQYEYTISRSVSIWLDTDSLNSGYDHSLIEEEIRMAATMLCRMIDSGIPAGLYCNGLDCVNDRETFLFAGSAAEHKDRGLTALARLDLTKPARPMAEFIKDIPEGTGGDELIVLISAQCSERLVNAALAMQQSGRELFWIIPVRAEEEPELSELSKVANSCVWRVVCER